MAGAGYKLFNTGDVLTAAQVNTYLQEQAVMRFANAAARTTALSGVLAEGMMSYLDDTNSVEVYNGSAWVSVGSTGDITGVTAGTGLTGGGTSGDVTLSLTTPVSATNGGTAQTTYTTGDLLYASGTNTLAKRAIGTTGQVLTVSGGVPTWATPAAGGGGKVLQVVYGSSTTSTTIASTTFADTNLSASITPSATSSRILVLISQIYAMDRSTVDVGGEIRLLRGSTTVYEPALNSGYRGLYLAANGTSATSVSVYGMYCMNYVDSPNTTSSITYKTQGRVYLTTSSGQIYFQSGSSISNMILLEIGA